MVRSEDQTRCQCAIERPEEELDASRMHRFGVDLCAWLEYAGEFCAKEVEIIVFKTAPDANVLGHIFSKLDQDMGQCLTFPAGEMQRIIRQRPLGFGEEPCQFLGDFHQWSLVTSQMSLRSMDMKIQWGSPSYVANQRYRDPT